MKIIKVRLQNIDGSIEQENELFIGNDDILIMQFPESMSIESKRKCFDGFNKYLESGRKEIGLPNSVSFKILKS